MNARELHDWMRNIADTEPGADVLAVTRGFYETILRALDLLARTEESTDEVVRELRDIYKWCSPQYGDPMKKAAATIVALNENCAMLKRTVENQDAYIVALKAERDALLPIYEHAHGMTFGVDWNKGTAAGYHRKKLIKAVEAYRAAHPKDAPMTDEDRIAGYHANLQEKP